MEQTDIWSISPSTSATFFKTAATVTGGTFPRALTLTNTDPVVAKEGAGYKVIITSGGNDSGITFTINGAVVGELNNKVPAASTPEVLLLAQIQRQPPLQTIGHQTLVLLASGSISRRR
jgi:hypothetical protein